MSQFIESLRRLFRAGRLSEQTLNNLLASEKISKQEYLYIIAAD